MNGAMYALDYEGLGDFVDDGVGSKDAFELVENFFGFFLACVLHAEGKSQHTRLGGLVLQYSQDIECNGREYEPRVQWVAWGDWGCWLGRPALKVWHK